MSYEPENPTSDIGDDAQRWLFAEFERISREFGDLQQWVKNTFAATGHAGLNLDTPTSVGFTINGTPSKLTGFDAKIEEERAATASVADSNIVIDYPGIWFGTVNLSFAVDASTANNTREVVARLYNETDAVSSYLIGTGSVPRYGEVLSISGSVLGPIPPAFIGDDIAIYLEALGDDVVVTDEATMDFSVHRISNFESDGV